MSGGTRYEIKIDSSMVDITVQSFVQEVTCDSFLHRPIEILSADSYEEINLNPFVYFDRISFTHRIVSSEVFVQSTYVIRSGFKILGQDVSIKNGSIKLYYTIDRQGREKFWAESNEVIKMKVPKIL